MFYIFFFFIGTAVGSFLNVLIDRLPNETSIMGRSHCDFCTKTLSPWDLIPVISFLFLKGRCRYCGKKLSYQYPFIELLTGFIFLLVFIVLFVIPSKEGIQSINNILISIFSLDSRLRGNDTIILNLMQLGIYLAVVSCFIVIFFADVKYQIIPDEMQISLLILAIFQKIMNGATITSLGSNLFAAVLVMAPILFLYLITKGRGMGFGDVKLSFIVGMLLGIKGGLSALYIAFVMGAVVGIYFLIRKKKKMKSKIAFGPFIILGVVAVILFHQQIFGLVQRIYGI